MGLRINTNVASIHGQEILRRNKISTEQDYKAGSSGKRINEAADDAAGLSISEYTRGKNVSLGQALRNANDGVSVVQVAEGGMQEIGNILTRLKELSIQASSATIGDTERGFVNIEVNQLKNEIDKIAAATQFDDRKLLGTGMGAWEVQIGTEGDLNNRFSWKDIKASTTELGISSVDLSTVTTAQNSITPLEKAITQVVSQRALIGGMQSRLESTIRGSLILDENQKATMSRVVDADIGKVSADMTKDNILNNATTSVLTQANTLPQGAIKLLQV